MAGILETQTRGARILSQQAEARGNDLVERDKVIERLKAKMQNMLNMQKCSPFFSKKRQITPKTVNRAKDAFFACFFKDAPFFTVFQKNMQNS